MGVVQSPVQEPQVEEDDSPNQVFEVLKNDRRRAVLRYLHEEEPEASFRDLVEYVAARENGTSPEDVTAAQRNRVRTALYQHHLDKLADMGFVEYDKRDGVVRRNGRTDELVGLIEPTVNDAPRTAVYALGFFLLGVGVLIASISLPSTVAGVIVGALGLASVVYEYQANR